MQITDKQLDDILKDMVIIVDNREKRNTHIKVFLERNGIPYVEEKMDTADYTFILPNYPHLKLDRTVLVERKNSLDEIAGNFTRDRARFKKEFDRIGNAKMHLVIENASFNKLYKGSYRSKFPPRAFAGSLFGWSARYDVPVWYANPNESPRVIYDILHYGLRDKVLKLAERS